jgi:ABC-type sugar transport system ATPase subunit
MAPSSAPASRARPDAPVVAVHGLTKRYGGVTVLDDVSLQVHAGEVHALLGENGAGKSTLIKILSGVVRADGGSVDLDGQPVTIHDPHGAQALGIATLHQELSIVPGLSVAENILLGQPLPTRLGRIRWSVLHERATALLDSLGQRLDVRGGVEGLTPVGRTMVALARALSRDARVLVLDEPTASLTDTETSQLFAAMRRLSDQGVAILYVSHRLEEVLEVCDRYTVLRNGRTVAEGAIADTTVPALIAAMAGRAVEAIFPPRPEPAGRRPVVLQADRLSGHRVRDVSFALHAGEVLGIAGLAGSGRSEIVRLVSGAQRAGRAAPQLRLHGRPHAPRSVRDAQRHGVALVPQERREQGLVPDTVERNANLTTLGRHTVGRVVVANARSRRHARDLADQLGVRRRSMRQPVLTLSGGNQQKVVLAKYLALGPSVLCLDEPTRGVDVATKGEIYHLIRERTAQGLGVIVVSSELPELLGLCDRILVLHEGRTSGVFEAAATSEDELLHACYGHATATSATATSAAALSGPATDAHPERP